MTYSTDVRTQPTEFVGVIRLVNCYIAIHCQDHKKAFVSKYPEIDIKIAQATAKAFAETKSIPCNNTLLELKQPIITVIKYGNSWFPAELHPDKITLLTNIALFHLGGNKEEATNMAFAIALSKGADFIPSMDISLESYDVIKSKQSST